MPYLYAVQMNIPGHPFNPVKVGYSTNPTTRLEKHYGGGPYPVEVLGIWEGTKDDERDFHRRYKERRLAGEWFHPTDEMLDEVWQKLIEYHVRETADGITAEERQVLCDEKFAFYLELREGQRRFERDPEYKAQQMALAAEAMGRLFGSVRLAAPPH